MSDFLIGTAIGIILAVMVKVLIEELRWFAPRELLPVLMIGPGLGLLMKGGYNNTTANIFGCVFIIGGFILLVKMSKQRQT